MNYVISVSYGSYERTSDIDTLMPSEGWLGLGAVLAIGLIFKTLFGG